MTSQQMAETTSEQALAAEPDDTCVARRVMLRVLAAIEQIGVVAGSVRVLEYPPSCREILIGGSVEEMEKLAAWIEAHA